MNVCNILMGKLNIAVQFNKRAERCGESVHLVTDFFDTAQLGCEELQNQFVHNLLKIEMSGFK